MSAHRIQFHDVEDAYGIFSNFAPFPIRLDGTEWPTVEHYFQAQKFQDDGLRENIRTVVSPDEAARLGRDRTKPLRTDWEEVKIHFMYEALLAKFTQHTSLRAELLATGNAPLEHSKPDAFWGNGGDGTGRNMLGVLLMRVREELRRSPTA